MRVAMVVYDEDAFDGAPHAEVLVVVLQALQPRGYGRVFLRLRLFCAEREVRERVPATHESFAQLY